MNLKPYLEPSFSTNRDDVSSFNRSSIFGHSGPVNAHLTLTE